MEIENKKTPNLFLRLLWMIFIGSWLAPLFYIVGLILTLLIITAPLGMMVIQKIGWAFSLYSENDVVQYGDNIVVVKQPPHFILRFIYFIFFGWWIGGIALFIAIISGITIIGLPLSFYIINRLGLIMTLSS